MPSYMERTLKVLKSNEFMVQKVEHFNAHGGVRQDLFGFIDILAVHPAHGTIGVQVCGPDDFAAHMTKILGPRREALILWLTAGNRAILVGWRSLKGKGWTPRVHEFTLAGDLPEITGPVLAQLCSSHAVGPDEFFRCA